jgi:pyruvate ferredoxin oxidoreductase beta subunit
LWEAEHGDLRFTHEEPHPKPIKEFTKLMGRFSHLSEEELQQVQEYINHRYTKIKNLACLNDSK